MPQLPPALFYYKRRLNLLSQIMKAVLISKKNIFNPPHTHKYLSNSVTMIYLTRKNVMRHLHTHTKIKDKCPVNKSKNKTSTHLQNYCTNEHKTGKKKNLKHG